MDSADGLKGRGLDAAERDVIALGIAIAAIILFIGTGGSALPQAVGALLNGGKAPDLFLTNALLLNIALLIFGWRRYNDLRREIRERFAAEQQARELAERDALTGCLNRRSGPAAIEALRQRLATRGQELVVLMIDLDNFKQINDVHGHKVGDLVLSTIGRRLETALPADSVIVRVGGDEFVCAFAGPQNSLEHIDNRVAAMIAQASRPVLTDNTSVEATVSIGITRSDADRADDNDVTPETLIHRADIAMYHAKKQGRNRAHWFAAEMEDELRYRNELEANIRAAVANDEFVPFYEQQVDIGTGELAGFEMLARWDSPRYGMVSPDIFIPVAEEIDLISELSEKLMRKALLDAVDWDASLTLSVNVSPVQLRDPWFAQKLLQLLVETGFPPARLEIEITESCLHENVSTVRSIVTSLKNQGIRIALDDFGTGYSSLSQLRTLPFDRMKIDRSFVSELATDGRGRELVEAIVSLGKSLALPVTAEGVVSNEILSYLQSLGEMKGQGFLYGEPADVKATRALLASLGLLRSSQDEELAFEELPRVSVG
ncbi:putative bifunctional diguanylate cyclase/phosphodiesterase [Aurantiacibacter gangjinensis]|uniref:Diguanylate cyclase n=1 Tax=Aurantiacibacter gangjinensis TaxID=502682 RepID=A0A0G9MQS8_9SPHN|nr:EAL domain-containing protein [Aurantiacibacter gangjinensis]KLE33101.1 diguanylate cyclase [Aurantiacibacter gangjinensis]